MRTAHGLDKLKKETAKERRMIAWKLHYQHKWQQCRIAELFGTSQGVIHQLVRKRDVEIELENRSALRRS